VAISCSLQGCGNMEGMPFSEVIGDLFEVDAPAIGHGCNTERAMGAGIAVEFKRRYPDMYKEYKRRCSSGAFSLGDVFVWETQARVVYNLATQPRPGPSASVEAIQQSVTKALAHPRGRGVQQGRCPTTRRRARGP
jgi:O-acetyl-ADP-ribose deacetylase (regulator of RNase III)